MATLNKSTRNRTKRPAHESKPAPAGTQPETGKPASESQNPNVKQASRDAELAQAYRYLDGVIEDLLGAAILLELATGEIWKSRGERFFAERSASSGYEIYALTPEQSKAISYAAANVGDLARKVHGQYTEFAE